MLGGFDIISGPGMLEFESAFSLEKLVLDNEVCGLLRRLARGFDFTMEEVALDVIRESVLEKSGNYLLHPHTRKMLRKEVHLPRTWDQAPRSRWPGRDIYEEAHLEVERILSEGFTGSTKKTYKP